MIVRGRPTRVIHLAMTQGWSGTVRVAFAAAALAVGMASACTGADTQAVTREERGTDACPTGLVDCHGRCVDVEIDPAHCGGCGEACEAGLVCSLGICAPECLGGSTRCAELCVDPELDPAHCGGCDNACRSGEVCSAGACGLVCLGGATKCGSKCVDLLTDPANCGVCGNGCATDEACSNGTCALACGGGATKCGAKCVDTELDPAHCGGCGAACPAGEICSGGVCVFPCGGGATKCGTACVDTTTDPSHCGMCNNACAAKKVCMSGDCTNPVCTPIVVEVAAGVEHTCARKQDGTLWCWGNNGGGQLGNGTNMGSGPIQVSALGTSAAGVAAGQYHTCARKQDGTLWCWGNNFYGQLGDGTIVSSVNKWSPVQVAALGTTVAEVTAGQYHTCARTQDGTLWCWGGNQSGQLGNGTKSVTQGSPVQVSALGATAVEVAAGEFHTCARKQDGSLWCWGQNSSGQLGDGTNMDSSSPVQVAALGATVVAVATRGSHTCARKQDGSLWCWGQNFSGQLGAATYNGTPAPSPLEVSLLGTSVAEVAAGSGHTCARMQDGSLWCWGSNYFGQLTWGTTTMLGFVQEPSLGTSVVEVATGGTHTCARKQDGSLWCWGSNSYGQLGVGAGNPNGKPLQVPLCP